MIRNEMTSPKLKSLSDDELYDRLVDVWSAVKLLSGALLHEGDMLLLQLEMLRDFLATSSFRDLTVADLTTAFKLNAAGDAWETIPHYNREINAEWVGQVLRKYTDIFRKMWRDHGDAIRKALLPPVPEKPKPGPLPESFWQGEIQKDLELLRAGKAEWIFNRAAKYCYLRKLQAIPMPSRAWWKHSVTVSMRILSRDKKCSHYTEYYRWMRYEQETVSRGAYREACLENRKRWYLAFLELMRDTAIVDIWRDVDFS